MVAIIRTKRFAKQKPDQLTQHTEHNEKNDQNVDPVVMRLRLVERRCGRVKPLIVERSVEAGRRVGCINRGVERQKELVTDQVLNGGVVGHKAGRAVGELINQRRRISGRRRRIGR